MSIIVVFYSRYSMNSLQYLEEVEKIMEVRKLCIDNEEVRDQIIMEKENYNIEYVPSTLIFHPNGFMEKHSGMYSCMEWLEKVKPKQEEIPIPKQNIEEVRPIEKIPIDKVEFEPRRMDTTPLIAKKKEEENLESKENIEEKIKEERESQAQNNMKKNNTNDSILSIAQQMQKQRESEVSDS